MTHSETSKELFKQAWAALIALDHKRQFSALTEKLAISALASEPSTATDEPVCPRPCNDRPDDFTMAQCILAGECGCTVAGSAYRPVPPPRTANALLDEYLDSFDEYTSDITAMNRFADWLDSRATATKEPVL